MEQGTRCLRELAVLEIIFSEDERFPKSPDDVQCTSQMWLRFARLGPEMYSRYLATLQWRESEDKLKNNKYQSPQQQYTDGNTAPTETVIPIHEMIQKLESQGVVSKARSPFNSPIWPVRKSSGEWRLTVDYCALNEVTPPLSAAVPDMLELQYELESKAAKWYATIDIANAFFSIPLAAECRAQFAFTWKGVQYTWNRLPQGWKHSPTICHGLIQTALEKGEAPEHLQYIDDIIRSKVKGPAQEIQFLGVKWQDGRRQIPTEVINKIIAMSPPTSKKETQAFLGAIGFWRMHIPEYSQIVSPLYLVTRKKNDFHWGPEQQQAFAHIKQEIAHAVALGPVRTGPEALTGNGRLQYGAPHDELHKLLKDKVDQVKLQNLKPSS
ncbi:hypothetical protein DUI87_33639 [Hirundo rustica rustica]|uniref:ribonuclease H n=1 Tax=Hirundo rustica rustica TaxID=333673 RepID=A0A3M0INH8_HIRRU|nr:hypothetical protein DUI87_33639 [Hirundo rustica rustica]